MGGSDWATIFVAIITVISAIFSGRSARNAAKYNSDASVTNAKIQAETEAYNRARSYDTETIERQDKEIEEIRKNNDELRSNMRRVLTENLELREENDALRRRVTRLEQLGERYE